MTAEAIGVASEVILVSVIIKSYIDRKDIQRWKATFAKRIQRLLDVHKEMPHRIATMELVGDVNMPHKIIVWGGIAEEHLRDALALIPPSLTEPAYVAAEQYLEALRFLATEFMNQEMHISSLRTLNIRAQTLAQSTGLPQPATYLWAEDVFLALEPQLSEVEW